jgi:pimeloyl-ACP methyl ester carboxylesterase
MMEMPPLQFAQANGVRLAFYDAGPRDDPTPFVLCHGFPEIAFTWRRQIKGLSDAGFRAIALDQRGYGASDRPPEVEAYSIDRLAGDVIGLLDHLGIDRAIVVGHDWGGYVVWETAVRYPDRVAGVVSLNSPHVKRAPADPIAMLRARFGDRMYIVQFQDSREPDRILAENVDKVFDALLRGPCRAKKPVARGRAPTKISSALFRPTTPLETPGRRSCPRRSGRSSSRPSDGAASPAGSTGIATSPATGKTLSVAIGPWMLQPS